ncbi:MAG: hypothetical protein L6Q71_00300 [Planctomycetes bacterium]|nr:hypothetical protein [Planctomycetota bacterium]NUQ35186.1 hypothetical protein [Planctomycetaceae bacterium]
MSEGIINHDTKDTKRKGREQGIGWFLIRSVGYLFSAAMLFVHILNFALIAKVLENEQNSIYLGFGVPIFFAAGAILAVFLITIAHIMEHEKRPPRWERWLFAVMGVSPCFAFFATAVFTRSL